MNSDMIVKNVDVMGDSIMAAKDKDGTVWAGVSYFCRALGMTNKQRDTQVEKVRTDRTLAKGFRKFPGGVFDQNNETTAIRIDFIPLWLAKISVTDRMEQDHPELAEKLLAYQLKAKDILAEAFTPKQMPPSSVADQIKLLAQGNVEVNQRVDALTERVDKIELDLPVLPVEADRITMEVRRRGVAALGGKQSAAYKSRELRQKLYNNLYANLKYNFGVKTYKSIKRSQVDTAIEIVRKYEPPLFLKQEIEKANSVE